MLTSRSPHYSSRFFSVLTVIVFSAISAVAQVRDYTRIVVFGDSLSDTAARLDLSGECVFNLYANRGESGSGLAAERERRSAE